MNLKAVTALPLLNLAVRQPARYTAEPRVMYRAPAAEFLNIIKREAFSQFATCEHWAIVTGRCLISLISDGNKTTTFVNMHFYNFSQHETSIVQNFINTQNDIARQDPINHHVIVVGDMNFRYSDKPLLNAETSKF